MFFPNTATLGQFKKKTIVYKEVESCDEELVVKGHEPGHDQKDDSSSPG